MFLFFYSSLAIIIDEKLKLYDSEKRGTKRFKEEKNPIPNQTLLFPIIIIKISVVSCTFFDDDNYVNLSSPIQPC